MAYKQKNSPFTFPESSSLSMSTGNPDPLEKESGTDLGSIINRKIREKATAYNEALIQENLEAVENMNAEDNLAMEAGRMMNMFTNTEDPESGWMPEGGANQKDYIENTLFADVGYTQVWDKDKQEYRPVDSTRDAWSAAAVSKLATAFDSDFQGSAQHAQYINDAFQGNSVYTPDKFNVKRNLKGEIKQVNTEFKPGDILFTGRTDSDGNPGPQTYREFKNAAKKGWNNNPTRDGYVSHSDIITDVIVGEDGVTRFRVQGGNIGNTLTTKTYTAEELATRYAGRLTK